MFATKIIIVYFLVYNISTAAARSKNMPADPIKLYYLPPSPPSRAVMMTARALGLELDLVLTNILEGAHMTPEYLKIWYNTYQIFNYKQAGLISIQMNPQHTIPTMDDNGFVLWESRAIMAYLVNAYNKNDSLYPKNPRLRALVDQRLNFDLGTLYTRYANLYVPMLFRGEEYNEENAAKLDEALGWMEKMLEGRAFLAGDNLTIADISIVVTFTNLEAFEYDFSAHQNVNKWFDRTKKTLEPFGYKEIDYAGGQMLAAFMKKE